MGIKMNRRNLFGTGFAFITAAAASALGKDKDKDKDKDDKRQGKGKVHQDKDNDQGEKHRGKGNNDGYFRVEDHAYLRQYYGGPVSLPPGLRKKYSRTGKLPPGWEKRFQPFPPALVQQLPPTPPYYERGYLDGQAVVFDRRTRTIVDVLNIVGGAMRQ